MELSYRDRIQRVDEILREKKALKQRGKRLPRHLRNELNKLCAVPEEMVYGLNQRGLSKEERKHLPLFWIENSEPKRYLKDEVPTYTYQLQEQRAAERSR